MLIKTLSKAEQNRRLKFKCTHRHSGLSHPECYKKANGLMETVGFLDIEASNLNASFGIIYTYCLKELNGKMHKRAVTIQELYKGLYDKKLLEQLIKDMEPFTRVVVHYGTDRKFDLPFVRTRAEYWRLDFPRYKCMYASDTWVMLKNKFKLHSNRLETACDFFNIPSKKHKLKSDVWLKMITGNPKLMKEALAYIMLHNEEDVISLEKLYKRIYKFIHLGKTSI